MRKISGKIWTQAFVIGILGSIIFKGIEVLVQSISFGQLPYLQMQNYGISIGSTILLQLFFLQLVSSILIFILMKLSKRLWVISFVPFLFYLVKEAFNMLVVVHKFTWASHPIIESLFALSAIPIGFGVYYLIKKMWK